MKNLLGLLLLLLPLTTAAQDFNDLFTGETLRLDYVFAGNAVEQRISLSEAYAMPGWWGKRRRMSEVPLEGNGQVIVRQASDNNQGEVIYRQSFSTLFQEWLTYDEAQGGARAFDNVFLVPMPRADVDITVELYDNRRTVVATATHRISPSDILIRRTGEETTPYDVLQAADNQERAIRLAFVAEGYRPEEMDVFVGDARKAMEAIFSHEPFRSMRTSFNVIAVKAPSTDSGTSTPHAGQWRRTALGSHFDTFYSARYLTTLNLRTLHDALAGTPYEHILILVNTAEYGGGGILNSYVLSAAHNSYSNPVVVHEFGHSFGGLADEYAYDNEPIPMYPLDIEPWEPNITTLVDYAAKWQNMPGAALYEGAGYSLKGVYRSAPDCRMRTNAHPDFCAVCRQALQRVIDFYVDDTTP